MLSIKWKLSIIFDAYKQICSTNHKSYFFCFLYYTHSVFLSIYFTIRSLHYKPSSAFEDFMKDTMLWMYSSYEYEYNTMQKTTKFLVDFLRLWIMNKKNKNKSKIQCFHICISIEFQIVCEVCLFPKIAWCIELYFEYNLLEAQIYWIIYFICEREM